jgi:hypothetical protein
MDGLVNSIPPKFIYGACSILAAVVLYILKVSVDMTKQSIAKAKEQLEAIGPTLAEIKNNHLSHIQSATEAMSAKQDATNVALAEQTGYLKSISENLKK